MCLAMPKGLSEIQVKEIMTTKILAAQAEDNVLDVAKAMLEKNFNGVPVVDKDGKLRGMITMKELLDSKGIYLPTAINLLANLHMIHGEDLTTVDKKLKALYKLKASDVMNREPLYLVSNTSLEKAAEAFLLRHEDLLPVVDDFKTLVGVVSKYDILKSLTNPLEPIKPRPSLTEETEIPKLIEEVEKKYVVVSQARARFWYFALIAFLVIGIIISLAVIIRIRIL